MKQEIKNQDPNSPEFFQNARKACTTVMINGGEDGDGETRWFLAIARENVPGYTMSPGNPFGDNVFEDDESAHAAADRINKEIFDLDSKEAYLIVASSMRRGGVK